MAQDRVEILALLRKAADEIAQAGHNGWGNLMLAAADALDAREVTVTDAMVQAAMAGYWTAPVSDTVPLTDELAMRAALTAALGVETSLQKMQTSAPPADERETVRELGRLIQTAHAYWVSIGAPGADDAATIAQGGGQ